MIAFQEDAYHPLVHRMGGAVEEVDPLCGGRPSLQEDPPGGRPPLKADPFLPRETPPPEGDLLEGTWDQTGSDIIPPPVNRQTGVETLPSCTSLAGGNVALFRLMTWTTQQK